MIQSLLSIALFLTIIIGCTNKYTLPDNVTCIDPAPLPSLQLLDTNKNFCTKDNITINVQDFKDIANYTMGLETQIKCYKDALAAPKNTSK